jgi:hypothetical protein
MVEQAGFAVREREQVGRSGWIRHSALAAYEAGERSWAARLARDRRVASWIAARTERQNQADFLRLVALRPM